MFFIKYSNIVRYYLYCWAKCYLSFLKITLRHRYLLLFGCSYALRSADIQKESYR